MAKIGKLLRFRGDRVVWVICFILSSISLISVYSSIGYTAIMQMHTSPTLAFAKHIALVVAAYVVAMITSNLNYQLFSRIASALYLVAMLLLIAILLIGGRWFKVPLIGSFQPSELAKVVVVIFTARTLALYKEDLSDKWFFWASLIPMSIAAALILPKNLSTAVLIFCSGLVMMYLGGVKGRYIFRTIALLTVGGALALFLSYQVFHSDLAEPARHTILGRAETWSNRVDRWLSPDITSLSQENMAQMAVADGGLLKFNIGGTVHARLMTQANNDFIYAIIVEETGSLTGIAIFLLYTILFYRCIMLAYWSRRQFGGLLIMGIGTYIYLQAIVHMLVSVGVMPVTGQTLPLISTGGTSYLITGFAIGLIQSVAYTSKASKKKAEKAAIEAAANETNNHNEQQA